MFGSFMNVAEESIFHEKYKLILVFCYVSFANENLNVHLRYLYQENLHVKEVIKLALVSVVMKIQVSF